MGCKKKIEEWLKTKLEVEVRISETWRTGKERRLVVAKCRTREEKEKIMENKRKLGMERVFIDNDLAWKERRVKVKILEKAREIKRKGKKVKIGYNKVISDREVWFWNERENKWFQKKRDAEESSKV